MTDQLYAWAPISHHDGDKYISVAPGDKVDESMFTKSDLEYMKSEGVVRSKPFPKGVKDGESVRTHLIRMANEAREEAEVPYRELEKELTQPNQKEPVASTSGAPSS